MLESSRTLVDPTVQARAKNCGLEVCKAVPDAPCAVWYNRELRAYPGSCGWIGRIGSRDPSGQAFMPASENRPKVSAASRSKSQRSGGSKDKSKEVARDAKRARKALTPPQAQGAVDGRIAGNGDAGSRPGPLWPFAGDRGE